MARGSGLFALSGSGALCGYSPTRIRARVQFLQSDESLFRVLPLPSFRVLEEPGYHLHGVWSITGFHDLTVGRYDRTLKEFEPLVQQFLRSGAPSAGFQSLLNLLNGKYLAVPKLLELDMAAYPLRFDGARYRLYENPQALPWFYLVSEAEVLDSGEAVLARLLSGRVDPQGVALLEKCAGGAARWCGRSGGGSGGAVGVRSKGGVDSLADAECGGACVGGVGELPVELVGVGGWGGGRDAACTLYMEGRGVAGWGTRGGVALFFAGVGLGAGRGIGGVGGGCGCGGGGLAAAAARWLTND